MKKKIAQVYMKHKESCGFTQKLLEIWYIETSSRTSQDNRTTQFYPKSHLLEIFPAKSSFPP